MDQAWQIAGIVIAVVMVLIGLVLIFRKPKPTAPIEQTELIVEPQSLQPIVPRHLRQMPETTIQPTNNVIDSAEKTVVPVSTIDEKASAISTSVVEQKHTDSPAETETDTTSDELDQVLKQLDVEPELPADSKQKNQQQQTQHTISEPIQQQAEQVNEVVEEIEDKSLLDAVELSEWQGESDVLDAHISEQNRQDEESALATAQQFVALYLYPNPARALSGERALRMLLKYGLRYGEMSCFHRYQDPEHSSPLMFSVLRINEEGAPTGFDLETLLSEEVKGLAFFLALPNANAVEGFDMMISLSGLMARDMEGTIYDEQSLELTPQLRDHWRHFVIEYKPQ
ncbi:cell division protein ZipA [Acinetobacter qingfengensis]|uniref:Cell division protein ZipA n=1 Tax=Acinetobacter qingfengensis TaxID=1262585 RepID=A0A1E7RCH8_9GAMM|nr:cell division protein ZipA C-terminal FtsZ-binding domain-containing protein [Acinetobacter qingfengensis]KAA8734347.1 cell division protein ZipA [Acinetobacter qingfengensis]OEY97110.1 hypothetical protein BJI46_10835 [Acinetobacter qingfengensis]